MTLSQGIRPYRVQVSLVLPYADRPGRLRVRNARWPRVSVLIFMHIIVYIIYIIITIYTINNAFRTSQAAAVMSLSCSPSPSSPAGVLGRCRREADSSCDSSLWSSDQLPDHSSSPKSQGLSSQRFTQLQAFCNPGCPHSRPDIPDYSLCCIDKLPTVTILLNEYYSII